MNKVKLALLGCGDVAQRDYLPEFHRLAERAEIVAVCGRTASRASSVADQYHIPAWYDDYERMLAECDADAVINLTPIQLHASTTLAALAAGKHVYSEKPVATSLADAIRIRDEAEQRGLTVVCAPSVLLFPQVQYARELARGGDIGPIHAALGRGFGGVPPWSGYASDPSPFFAAGGGPLADMGVYPLHAITGILGPAKRVSAFASHVQEDFVIQDGDFAGQRIPVEVEDNWMLLLDLGEARLATVSANNVAHASQTPQMELYGLDGTLAVDLLDVSAPVDVYRPADGWQNVKLPHDRSAGPDHLLGVAHLIDCIESGAKPLASIDHALHVIDILESAARSATTGRAIELAQTWQGDGMTNSPN